MTEKSNLEIIQECVEYGIKLGRMQEATEREAGGKIKAEREQFAKALIDFIDANNVVVPDEEDEDSDDMLFTGEIRAKIESLRSTRQEQP